MELNQATTDAVVDNLKVEIAKILRKDINMDANKKIAFNSVVIFARLCISSLVAIYASRVVLDALGASDYGLYNVVGGIVALLNVVNAAMMSTTYRYIAFEIGKKDSGHPNKVFNASFAIHFVFAFLILIVGLIVGEWYIDNYLNVPIEKIDDAKFVFHISLITTALSTMYVPYQGLLVAFERFSFTALVEIGCQLIKLGAILIFIYRDGNRLRIYSIIMMCYTLLFGVIYVLHCWRKYKYVVTFKINRDWSCYKEMFAYALWTLFGAVAIIGKSQLSVMMINFFFGTIVNAAYAVASQIEGFVLTFARSLNNAAIPQITKSFSGGDSDRSITLTSYISKYTFILMTLASFPIVLEMDFVLGVWLKEVPEGASVFCKLMILSGLIGCLGEGIPALVNATGNIKTYQIIFHSFNLLGLPIAFMFLKLGFPAYTLLVVYIVISLLAAILRIYLLYGIFKFDVSAFIKVSYTKMAIISIPLIIFYYFYSPASFSVLGHIVGMVVAEVYLALTILLLGTDKRERHLIKGYIESYRAKRNKTCNEGSNN